MNDVDVVDKVDDMGDCHVVFYFDDVYEVDGVDKISNINDQIDNVVNVDDIDDNDGVEVQ